jgi:hypothetical protein
VDVALEAQRRAVRSRTRGADGVHAPDGAADVAPLLGVQLVERAAAHLGERGVEDALHLVQRRAGAEIERGHGRKLGVGEIQQEPVLVEDGLARPAAGAVELHDEAALVHELDLVDAVLEGAERQAAAGAAEPACLDRVEHAVRGEGEEGRVGLGGHRLSSVPYARSALRRRTAARCGTAGCWRDRSRARARRARPS